MIGFVVNPIAGMGGRVALKGTDGVFEEAIKRGAQPVSPAIARAFLSGMESGEFLTVSGEMGADYIEDSGLIYRVVYDAPEHSSSDDTRKAVAKMMDEGAGIIVFVGGDGTARDVVSVVGKEVPVLGIPSGVKMYSSCFTYSPQDAAHLLRAFMDGKAFLKEAEILDIDEEAYRKGEFRVRLYATAMVPYLEGAVQSAKAEYSGGDEEEAKQEIAEFIVDEMEPGVLYLLGAGSTVSAIAERLGQEKTILGIDAYLDGKLVAKDLGERGILGLLDKYSEAKLIISPIGAQGFVLGRGNQQISPKVLKKLGMENIIVIATPGKLASTPELHIYTGDPELDASFRGYMRVLTGYGRWKMKRVL